MAEQEKIYQLEEKVKELEKSLSAKEKICEILTKRVERSVDSVGGAYSIFERNILLQNLVDQRSGELEDANKKLSQEINERIKAEAELRESEARLFALNKLQELLLHPNSIEQKLKLVTDAVVRIVDADFARIWMIKPGDRCQAGCIHTQMLEGPHTCRVRDRCLHLMASSGRYTHTDGRDHSRVPFGAYKIGKVAAGEEPQFLTNEVTNDPLVHNHTWAKELGLTSFAGYRLIDNTGTRLGVLALFSKQVISAEEDLLLQGIADATSQVLQSARAEEALWESEEKYRTLIETTGTGFVIIDQDSLVLDANPEYVRLTGHNNLNEIVGRSVIEWTADYEKEKNAVAVGECFKKGYIRNLEIDYVDSKGSITPIEINATCLESEGVVQILTICRDITERKRIEESLRDIEARYTMIMNNITDRIWLTDMNFKVIWASESVMRIRGYQLEEINPFPFEMLLTPDSLETVIKTISEKLTPQRLQQKNLDISETLELEFLRKDGSTFWSEVKMMVLRDHDGTASSILGVGRDITERKRVEEEKRSLQERLQRAEKMEALGTLAGGVAHDLNNVLGIVVGYAEMLLMNTDKSSPIRPELLNIMAGGQRAAAIVQDLLTMARRGVSGRKVLNLNKIISDSQQSPEFKNLSSYHPSIKIRTDLGRVEDWRATSSYQYVSSPRYVKPSMRISRTGLSC